MRWANLGLRFACEVAAVVAFVWWGWIVEGVVAGAIVIVLWGAFVAPKAARRLPDPWRFTLELVIFAAAAASLLALSRPIVAAAFLVVAVASAALVRRWPEP